LDAAPRAGRHLPLVVIVKLLRPLPRLLPPCPDTAGPLLYRYHVSGKHPSPRPPWPL